MARMLYRNIGMNRDERIQNTFTRYLTCALDRENARFRYKQRQEQKMQPYDETGDEPASGELLAALADRQVTQASNPRSWQDFLQQVDAGWLYKALHALERAQSLSGHVEKAGRARMHFRKRLLLKVCKAVCHPANHKFPLTL